MQITEFLSTAKWIESIYSESTKELLFSFKLVSMLSDITHGGREVMGEIGGFIGMVLKSTTELAVVRNRLLSHPFAPDVLKAFKLEALLSADLSLQIAQKTMSGINKEGNVKDVEEVRDIIRNLSQSWRLLTSCVGPLENLLVPKEISEEKDFDDILTIELRYEHEHSPQAATISEVLVNIELLYAAVAISLGERNYRPLSVLYVASGTSFRFDFKGLGEPIREIKELLVEAWSRIRHRKADDLHQNNKVLLGSLEVLRRIDSDAKENVLDPEEALRLREQVIKNTVELFEAGALLREIPNEETISNQKLIQGIHVKLLSPQPPNNRDSKTNGVKSAKKRSRRRGKRKSPSSSATKPDSESNGEG